MDIDFLFSLQFGNFISMSSDWSLDAVELCVATLDLRIRPLVLRPEHTTRLHAEL